MSASVIIVYTLTFHKPLSNRFIVGIMTVFALIATSYGVARYILWHRSRDRNVDLEKGVPGSVSRSEPVSGLGSGSGGVGAGAESFTREIEEVQGTTKPRYPNTRLNRILSRIKRRKRRLHKMARPSSWQQFQKRLSDWNRRPHPKTKTKTSRHDDQMRNTHAIGRTDEISQSGATSSRAPSRGRPGWTDAQIAAAEKQLYEDSQTRRQEPEDEADIEMETGRKPFSWENTGGVQISRDGGEDAVQYHERDEDEHEQRYEYRQHYQQNQYHHQQHDQLEHDHQHHYEQNQHQYPGQRQTPTPLNHAQPHERYTPAEPAAPAQPAQPVLPTFEIHSAPEPDISSSGHSKPYEYEHSNIFAAGTEKGFTPRMGDMQRKEVFLQVPSRIRRGEKPTSRKVGSAGRGAVV